MNEHDKNMNDPQHGVELKRQAVYANLKDLSKADAVLELTEFCGHDKACKAVEDMKGARQ